MTDGRTLKVTVTGDVAGFQRSMNASATAADQLGHKIGELGGNIGSMVNIAKGIVLYEAIKKAFDAFAGLEKFNVDLLHTSQFLQGNARAASTWMVISDLMGVSVERLQMGFAHLSTVMNSGSSALKQMGIAASDSHGKLRLINDVVLQAADYFHRHEGASNNAALANNLFGRSGYELLPILEQGRAGIARITDEASKYGLILDSAAISRNAAFTYQLKLAGLAAKGLAIGLGNALLPAITGLGMGLAKLVQDNLPALIAMINRSVSYVVGFIEGLTGVKLVIDPLAQKLAVASGAIDDTGTAMDKSNSAAQRLAAAIKKIQDRTTAATRAIDDQIKSLQAQRDAESFADRQAKLQQDLANKAKDIDKLRKDQYTQFWLGNFAVAQDIGDQITRAQQDQANISGQITSNTEDEATKKKIAALEKQKQSIQDAANKQIAAMQAAAKATTTAMSSGAASIPPMFSKAGMGAASAFVKDFGAEGIGARIGGQLMDAIFGPLVHVSDGGGHSHLERLGGKGFVAIGKAIGNAIGSGLATALGDALSKSITDWIKHYIIGGGGGNVTGPKGKVGDSGLASGGDAAPYSWHLVGEQGPELLHMGGQGGRVIPNRSIGGDMSGIESRLDRLIALLSQSPPSGTGTNAMLNSLFEGVAKSRRRGITSANAY